MIKLKMVFLIVLVVLLMGTVSASNVYLNKTGNGDYQIYQKPTYSSDWHEYELKRFITSAKPGYGPQDVYRINRLYQVNLTRTNPGVNGVTINHKKMLTNYGNWEKAVQIKSSVGDIYLGGGHGYEKLVSNKVYADGVLINPQAGKIITANAIKIEIISNFIHPSNLRTILAKVTTTYTWNGETMLMNNKYEWNRDITIIRAYAAMLPGSNDPTVSSIGQLHGYPEEHLIIGQPVLQEHTSGGVLSNEINDLHMSLTILNPEVDLFNYIYSGNTKTYFKINELYNKLYISLISPLAEYKVHPDTLWDITAEYRVWDLYAAADPIGGFYNTTKNVVLSMRGSGNIYYTTDGEDPNIGSSIYTGPIIIDNNTILKYMAVDSEGNPSRIYQQIYTIENTVPTITNITPAHNTNNIALNKIIKLTFSENIIEGTNYWIELVSSNGTPVKINKSINGNILTINHPTLAVNTKYYLKLHSGCVTDLAGNKLVPTIKSFTTTTDGTAPTIKSTDPLNNATGISRNKVIKIYFSEPVLKGTMNIKLLMSTGTEIPLTKTISATGNYMNLTHTTLLKANTRYNLKIFAGSVTDKAGNPIAAKTITFTTI